jgi:hypothetical protein
MKGKMIYSLFQSTLRLDVVIFARIVLLGVLFLCTAGGSAVAGDIGVHEILIDGTPVNLTPYPQPILVGNGTGADPLPPNAALTGDIVAPGGGVYTTPDGVFTIIGTVQAVNTGGQFASLTLTVTVTDNKPVLDGQFGGDVLDFVFRQSYAMALTSAGVAAERLNGDCNQSAQDAASQVQSGVNVSSTVVLPSLTGACAPLGRFDESATAQIPITPSMFVQGDLFFNFRQGAAGQSISPHYVVSASVPEPASLVLFFSGIVGMFGFGWRARKNGDPRQRHPAS